MNEWDALKGNELYCGNCCNTFATNYKSSENRRQIPYQMEAELTEIDTEERKKDDERKSPSNLAIDKFCERARKYNKQTTDRASTREPSDPRESICVSAKEINHRSFDTYDNKVAPRQRQEALSSGDDF